VPAVDVRGVRQRQQGVAVLSNLGRDDISIAGAGAPIVGLQRKLADTLQEVDALAQRFFLEPELVAREDRVRLILVESRQRRIEMRDARRGDGVVGRRVDAQPRRDLMLRLDDAAARIVEGRHERRSQ
jgi:hypothetical protein